LVYFQTRAGFVIESCTILPQTVRFLTKTGHFSVDFEPFFAGPRAVFSGIDDIAITRPYSRHFAEA
jgi:hypothetical protein